MPVQNRRVRRNTFFERKETGRKGKLLLDLLKKFRDSPTIDEVFESRLFSIGSISMFDIHADNRRPDCDTLLRSNQNSGIYCKLLVSGNARKLYPEIDSSGHFFVFLHFGRDKPYVVRIGNDAYATTTIKPDVKFAR